MLRLQLAMPFLLLFGCMTPEEGGEYDIDDGRGDTVNKLGSSIHFAPTMRQVQDLRITAKNNRIALRVFPATIIGKMIMPSGGPIAEAAGLNVARVRALAFEPGDYLIEVRELDGATGNFNFSNIPTVGPAAGTKAEGYLAGDVAASSDAAMASWVESCDAWRGALSSIYSTVEMDRPERVYECGTPVAIAGRNQFESTTTVGIVGGTAVGEPTATVTVTGIARPTQAEALSAWMTQCLTKLDADTQADRTAHNFAAAACSKPTVMQQAGGFVASGSLREWLGN